MIAADRAGVPDKRFFQGTMAGIRLRTPQPVNTIDPRDLINRLIINTEAKRKLQEVI
jgi:hypothetical protein